ncbi:MAG: DNA polymerase [Bacteroidales bacterium]
MYADYCQFEPGILASFSGDSKLIELYNSGDVYAGLAAQIGNSCTRKIAKELFLSFVYGMTKENIRRRIIQRFGADSGKAADQFFSQFATVTQWKSDTVTETKSSGLAKGPFSYIRRVSSDDSDRDIARWAPNHVIQSTASGIFKKALCDLVVELPNCRLLVPMHDAILLECPTSEVSRTRESIRKIMIQNFLKVCPRIQVKISFDSFYASS